jgi:hypothetical protein
MTDARSNPPPPTLPAYREPRTFLGLTTGRALWIIGGLVALLLALGVWLVVTALPTLLQSTPGATATTDTSGTAGDVRRIQATLFYVSNDGSSLLPTSREVVYGATPAAQARHIVDAQVQAPPEGRRSAIPTGTTVRDLFLTGRGEAYVDLGGAFVSGHSGGSLDEALAVYAIVNAITVNLPDISSVQILVDGKEVDTLAGHIDLRHPLGKAADWIQKGP